jgi:hypothetical protein
MARALVVLAGVTVSVGLHLALGVTLAKVPPRPPTTRPPLEFEVREPPPPPPPAPPPRSSAST